MKPREATVSRMVDLISRLGRVLRSYFRWQVDSVEYAGEEDAGNRSSMNTSEEGSRC